MKHLLNEKYYPITNFVDNAGIVPPFPPNILRNRTKFSFCNIQQTTPIRYIYNQIIKIKMKPMVMLKRNND